jgi:hypothetical protein
VDVTNSNTILAYLLALRDFPGTLSDVERAKLKTVARDLDIQPKAWKTNLEQDLLQTIHGNPQLAQSYQSYQEQLDRAGESLLDLLPEIEKIEQISVDSSPLVVKGIIPETAATGYEQQLNNVVIVVNQADRPEEKIQEYAFLDRVKELLDRDSP